jgi:hypothetical protein
MLRSITVILFLLVFVCCNSKKPSDPAEASKEIHDKVNQLTDLIVHDIFSPPVASRIYAYACIAVHEAVRHSDPKETSIVAKLNGFPEMPVPHKDREYEFHLASSTAFYTVVSGLIFSKEQLNAYAAESKKYYRERVSEKVYNNSVEFGEAVAKAVMARMSSDNYKKTRALEKYYGSRDDGKWQPTAPDYLDGTEPYWNQIKPLIMDSASQFLPPPPPTFDRIKTSEFYLMNNEVYQVGKDLSNDQKEIARFWDDNPFVMEHSGHLMLATKKQTPGGHWMGIATIACKMSGADAVSTARTYALTSIAIFDAFVSVFDTKYKFEYVRPITFINKEIDEKWEPFLQTPPFPEYTSGHSTITASAATVLSGLYGDKFAFEDTSDMRFIQKKRHFNSFIQAANECSVSRLYGGIHYRISIDKGAEAGKKIGEYILEKFR